MIKTTHLSQEELKACIYYDPETGVFSRVDRKQKKVGACNARNYMQINLKGATYSAGHLAWLYVYGAYPDKRIRFKNKNPQDLRIDNLELIE